MWKDLLLSPVQRRGSVSLSASNLRQSAADIPPSYKQSSRWLFGATVPSVLPGGASLEAGRVKEMLLTPGRLSRWTLLRGGRSASL